MLARPMVASNESPIGRRPLTAARRRSLLKYHNKMRADPEYRAKRAATHKRWTERNPEKYKECKIRSDRRRAKSGLTAAYHKTIKDRLMFRGARARARRLGLPFEIELSDVIIPERCPIFGMELAPSTGSGPKNNSPSLDRIDPEKGYTKGNIWVISALANRMKNDASPEQLIIFAKAVLKRFG